LALNLWIYVENNKWHICGEKYLTIDRIIPKEMATDIYRLCRIIRTTKTSDGLTWHLVNISASDLERLRKTYVCYRVNINGDLTPERR